MAFVRHNNALLYTCGVGLFGDFSLHNSYNQIWRDSKNISPLGGAGWVCAGFIKDKPGCKEVYNDFKTRWPIVLQTPKRRNSNSGNSFIFVVYDTKKKRKSKNNPEGKVDLSVNDKYTWPWEVV